MESPAVLTLLRILGGAGVIALSFSTTLGILTYLDDQKAVHGKPLGARLTAVNTGAKRDDLGWPGCTLRVIIPAAAVTATGKGISVMFGAGPSRGLHIADSLIGYSASEGPPYAFEKPATKLSFDGKPGALIARSSTKSSDNAAEFKLSKDKDLVIAFYVNDNLNDDPVAKEPLPGWRTFYKCNHDTDTVRAIGYEERSGKFVSHGILSIDVLDSS